MPPTQPQRLRLWQTIYRAPSLRAPRQLWQAELADHWKRCHPFLRATPTLATWTFASIGASTCEVIEHDDGMLVAVDRLHGETFEVDRNDLVVYRLDVNALFTHLMNLIGGRTRFDAAMQNDSVRRIGELPARLGAKTLHFSVRNDDASLLAAATELSGKHAMVLMVPTLRGCNCDIDVIADRFQVIITAADELFVATSNGITFDTAEISSLRFRLGLGEDSQVNYFRIVGQTREIQFNGKRISLPDSIGLWYLAEFLSRPHKTLDPVELEQARTGITARSSTSGTGERLDDEAKRDYEAELIELREDIAEAESFNDPGRLEQLRSEFQIIADELTKSKGKDGQSRITTDAGKSRRNVRQQMQRDINKKIAPQHPDLADHLLKAFKRSWMCYQPDDDPGWEF